MPSKIVHVSSAQRNSDVHPTSSHYTIDLPGDTRYKRSVCGLDLLGATFPKTQPIFTADNRFLDISHDSGMVTMELPVGNYGVADVLGYLNEKYPDLVYCRVVVTSGTFVIGSASSTNPIRLLFGTGPNKHRSAHTTLGFPSVDTGFASEHFGVMHVNLDSSPDVDLIVEEVPSASHQETHDGPILARIPLDNSNFTIKFWENELGEGNPFNPMYLPKITVRLRNSNGKRYDTFGFDHVLIFRVRYVADGSVLKAVNSEEYTFVESPSEPPECALPPPLPKKKKYGRNAVIGIGLLGGSYIAARKMAK